MSETLDIVEIYRTPRRIAPRPSRPQWFWRYKDGHNLKIMATGAEGYINLSDLLESMGRVLDLNLRDYKKGFTHQRISRNSGWPDIDLLVVEK